MRNDESSNGVYSENGLTGLLQKSDRANRFYSSLPEYAQDMLAQRAGSIQTEDELRRYAENILQGDK